MTMIIVKTRAKLILALAAVMIITVMLASCQDNAKEISLSLTIKNETEHEIQEIVFVGENDGRGNPWVYIPIVGTDDKPLSAGEERQVAISVSEKVLTGAWKAEVKASEAARLYDYVSLELKEDVKGFVITYGAETDFVFTPVA